MGLIGGIARTAVAAGTWAAVSNGVSRRQANRWAAEDQAHAQPQAYMPPPPGRYQRPMFQETARHRAAYEQPQSAAAQPTYQLVDPMSARLANLQQLANLKAQGILTEAEFQAQKSKILAG
jgi:hypothetical protein